MPRKTFLFVAICGLDSEVEQLKTRLAFVSGQLYYSWTVFGVEPSCVSVNLWCAILFLLVHFCVARVLKFSRGFCVNNAVLMNC